MSAILATYDIMKQKLQRGDWSPGERLPSLASLASSCSVSRTTMWRALALLKKDSLVSVRARGSIFAGSSEPKKRSEDEHELTWERLKVRLGRDILSGVYRDQAFPPVNKLALQYRTGVRTVNKALAQLAAEKIVVHEGRRYELSRGSSGMNRPVVALISEANEWGGIAVWDIRTQSIVESFERESQMAGRIPRTEPYDLRSSKGLIHICANIKQERNLCGCIVQVWNPWDEGLWRRWLDLLMFLTGRDFPVIVLDQAGNCEFPDTLLRSQRFRVLRISGTHAGEQVGDLLHKNGHRNIAYISAFFSLEWARERYEGIRRYFQQYGTAPAQIQPVTLDGIIDQTHLVITLLDLDEKGIRALFVQFTEEKLHDLCAHLSDIKAKGTAGIDTKDKPFAAIYSRITRELTDLGAAMSNRFALEPVQTALLNVAGDRSLAMCLRPLFEKALRETKADVWVCSDLVTAVLALLFLRDRKKRVPEEISVVGFENLRAAYEMRITTYDFNLSGMVREALLMIMDKRVLKSRPVISEVDGYVVERRTTRRS